MTMSNEEEKEWAPVVDDKSHTLILGFLPGKKSLEEQQYYADPRNQFWCILSRIYSDSVGTDYNAKLSFLSTHGIALWNVFKKDSITNDLGGFIRKHPGIKKVGFNGVEEAKHKFGRRWRDAPVFKTFEPHVLPSSSGRYPMPFEEKVQDWQEFLKRDVVT